MHPALSDDRRHSPRAEPTDERQPQHVAVLGSMTARHPLGAALRQHRAGHQPNPGPTQGFSRLRRHRTGGQRRGATIRSSSTSLGAAAQRVQGLVSRPAVLTDRAAARCAPPQERAGTAARQLEHSTTRSSISSRALCGLSTAPHTALPASGNPNRCTRPSAPRRGTGAVSLGGSDGADRARSLPTGRSRWGLPIRRHCGSPTCTSYRPNHARPPPRRRCRRGCQRRLKVDPLAAQNPSVGRGSVLTRRRQFRNYKEQRHGPLSGCRLR